MDHGTVNIVHLLTHPGPSSEIDSGRLLEIIIDIAGSGIGALAGLGAASAAGLTLASRVGPPGGDSPAWPSRRAGQSPAVPASAFDGEVAHHWASAYLALVVANGAPPPSAARLFSQLGMVLHAASAAGTPDDRPLTGRVAGALGTWNPPALDGDLHWPLVANAAFIHLLPRLYSDLSGPIMRDQLATAQRFTREAQPALQTRSADAGRTLAQALMDWELRVMQADQVQNTPIPTAAPPGPGSWQPTPPEYELAVLPQWVRAHARPGSWLRHRPRARYTVAIQLRSSCAPASPDFSG